MDVLERVESTDGSEVHLMFECPGCHCGHSFRIKGKGPVWEWNGLMDRPTFTPSLLNWGSRPEQRCHLYVIDGRIRFLDDCAHALKGQTVPLASVESA